MAPALNENDPYVQRVLANGPYGYIPVLSAPLLFTIVYAILAVAHLVRWFRSTSNRWLIIIAIGCILETAGNALRVNGHFDPQAEKGIGLYIAMQVLVVVTPVFFAATHFTILGKVMQMFGKPWSPVSPRWVVPAFVGLDIASLAIQGAGSSIAAINETDGLDPNSGGDIVVAGLAVQVFGYVVCDIIAIIFARRVWFDNKSHNDDKMPGGLSSSQALALAKDRKFTTGVITAFISALLVLMRSAFRTGEMSRGWIGPVATVEWYYYVFDATPITIAVLIMAIWYPADYLTKPAAAAAATTTGDDIEKANLSSPSPAASGTSTLTAAGSIDLQKSAAASIDKV